MKDYKDFINELVKNKIGPVLEEIRMYSLDRTRSSDNLKGALVQELNDLNNVIVPKQYFKVNEMIANSVKAYIKGINCLIDNKTDANVIYQGAQYITEGSHWLGLAKVRMWEALNQQ